MMWCVRLPKRAAETLHNVASYQFYIMLFTMAALLLECFSLPATTVKPSDRWHCTSDISKYKDSYCGQKGDITGCFYLELFEQYKSCAEQCNNVEQFSSDEERCNANCPYYLSADGGCSLGGDNSQTSTITPSSAAKLGYLAFLLLIPVIIVIAVVAYLLYTKRKNRIDEEKSREEAASGGGPGGNEPNPDGDGSSNESAGAADSDGAAVAGGAAGVAGAAGIAGAVDDEREENLAGHDAPTPNETPNHTDQARTNDTVIRQPENYGKEETGQHTDIRENGDNGVDARDTDPLLTPPPQDHVIPLDGAQSNVANHNEIEMNPIRDSETGNASSSH